MAYNRPPRRPFRRADGPQRPRPEFPSGPRRRPRPNADGQQPRSPGFHPKGPRRPHHPNADGMAPRPPGGFHPKGPRRPHPPGADGQSPRHSGGFPPKRPRRPGHPGAGGPGQRPSGPQPFWKGVRRPPKYTRPEAQIHPPEERREFELRQQREQSEQVQQQPLENLIVGRKPVLEALDSDKAVEKVFIQFGTHGPSISTIYTAAKRRGIPVQQAPRERIAEMSGGLDTQGVVAVVSPTAYLELDDLLAQLPQTEPAFLLLLDEIEDPHNLGALVRSALCFGLRGTVITKHHSAPVNATVMKTSAGAALSMPIARVGNLVQAINELKERGIRVIGTDAEATTLVDDADYTGPVALVIGNEGKGLRRLVKENCDVVVKVPMAGSFDSLNASVAGAVVMYAASRKRGTALP